MTDELNDHDVADDGTSGGFRPSRRTVLAVAAWTVPAVMIAQAAPALAATLPVGFGSTGTACKLPGNSNDLYKGYAFGLTLTNGQPCPTNVEILTMSIDANLQTIGRIDRVTGTNPPVCTTLATSSPYAINGIPAGQTWQLAIYTNGNNNSQAGLLTVTYTYTDCNNVVQSGTASVQCNGNTWNGGCRPFEPTTWDDGGCPQFKKNP